METYEEFKKKYPFNKTLTDVQHKTILEQIKQGNVLFYTSFIFDILKRKIKFPMDIIDVLAESNPTLERCSDTFIRALIKDIHTTSDSSLYPYFEKIKYETRYISLLSTLLKNGLWETLFLEYYLTDLKYSYVLIQLLDSWISYKVIRRSKIIDTTTYSLFHYFKEFNVEDQRMIVTKILPYLTLNPSLEFMKPCHIVSFELKRFEYTMYLKNISEFINQLETRIQQTNHPMDIEIRRLFIEQFPFKKNSQFRCVLNEMDKANYGSRMDDYYKQLEKSISSLQHFMSMFYDSKDKELTDAWEYVHYDYFEKRKRDIHVPFEGFINQLPPLHQRMILLRTKEELQRYSSKLNLDELNQPDDLYGIPPLGYAILFKNYEAVHYLITTSATFEHRNSVGKKKIDYNILIPYTKHGISMIDLAKYVNFKKVVGLLEKKEKIIERWRSKIILGYHQTTPVIASTIQQSHTNEYWFLAGSKGMYGAGIYFAETPEETNIKALHKGIILENDVYMGNPLYIKNFDQRKEFSNAYEKMDSDMIHTELQRRRYDSVIAVRAGKNEGQFMRTGTEYIVYNT